MFRRWARGVPPARRARGGDQRDDPIQDHSPRVFATSLAIAGAAPLLEGLGPGDGAGGPRHRPRTALPLFVARRGQMGGGDQHGADAGAAHVRHAAESCWAPGAELLVLLEDLRRRSTTSAGCARPAAAVALIVVSVSACCICCAREGDQKRDAQDDRRRDRWSSGQSPPSMRRIAIARSNDAPAAHIVICSIPDLSWFRRAVRIDGEARRPWICAASLKCLRAQASGRQAAIRYET